MLGTMAAAGAALVALTAAAGAQNWPTRPITLVVPFAAGGGIDVSVRIQAQHMSELLGQSIVVDNIGAAAGTFGTLNKAMSDTLDDPGIRKRLEELGLEIAPPARRSPEYLAKFLQEEIERWAKPIREAGISAD